MAYLTEPEDEALYTMRVWTSAQSDQRLRASLLAWKSVQFNAMLLRQGDDDTKHLTEQDRADFEAVLRLHAAYATNHYERPPGKREEIPGGDVFDFLEMLPDDFPAGDARGIEGGASESETLFGEEKERSIAFLDGARSLICANELVEGEETLIRRFIALPGLSPRADGRKSGDFSAAEAIGALLYGDELADRFSNSAYFYDGFVSLRAILAARNVPGVWDSLMALAVTADEAIVRS